MNPSSLRSLETLYADGFPGDSPAYRQWFVTAWASRAEMLYENGMPVAAGYLVPKTAVVSGREQRVFYLDAFSVYTPFRGKGYAGPLMRKLLDRAAGEGAAYVFLSPFSAGYYRQYGFVDVSYAAGKVITGGEDLPLVPASPPALAALYNAAAGNRLVLSEEGAQLVIDSYAADRKTVVSVGGVACGAVGGDRFEFLCGDERVVRCDALAGKKTELPTEIPAKPRVQARVVDAAAAMRDAAVAGTGGLRAPAGAADRQLSFAAEMWKEETDMRAAALGEAVFGQDACEKARRNHIFDEV